MGVATALLPANYLLVVYHHLHRAAIDNVLSDDDYRGAYHYLNFHPGDDHNDCGTCDDNYRSPFDHGRADHDGAGIG
jgi:hypothetical protein